MMNQENYVNVNDLHKQGWTISEIAAETGWHRTTVSKYLKDGPPAARATEAPVMTEEWRSRIDTMLGAYPRLLSVSVHNKLRAEGFEGSYPTVVRAVRDLRGPRFRAANLVSVPIHTAPGDEAQFDFCDVSGWAARFGWRGPLFVFGMILSWSRWRLWWFTTSQDRHHTFEGMARFFDEAGGVPAACRTDRMGALGRSQGRRFELHPPTVGFAAHHGTKITSCQAGDAKRKGKVERPFRQLQETFLPEVEADGIPVDIADLNRRAQVWLTERVHGVESRTTGETPAQRLEVERDFLAPLPRVRFDTDYVETRRVHRALPFITWDSARYSVPPACLGQAVEVRRAVDATELTVSWAGSIVARHRLAEPGVNEVWDPGHRVAAETAALASNRSRHLHVVTAPPDTASAPGRLELGAGDYDIAPPDLTVYEGGAS